MIGVQDQPQRNFLIIIAGPTAVGKTSTAISIARQFSTEIISADSRQFYREMKIGTAVPSADELALVPHHLIGNLSIHDYYNVFKFGTEALQILTQLFLTKKVVVMAGGSGLYIDTICRGIDIMPDADPEIREQLNQIFSKQGINPLRDQLKLLDKASYDNMDIANPKRIIRALEVCLTTGLPYSSLLKNQIADHPFQIIKIGLQRDRGELYGMINQRVDKMIESGLEAEARELYTYKDLTPLHTVGYREMFDYFEGKCNLYEAIEKIKVNTRRYAKKQLTWFSRDKEIRWFHPSSIFEMFEYVKQRIETIC